jgi:hypothetical protein
MEEDIIILPINATYKKDMDAPALFEATSFAWRIKYERRKNNTIKYAFATNKGIVVEVYKIDKWIRAEESRLSRKKQLNESEYKDKFAFEGQVAEDIRDYIINKPSFKKSYGGLVYGNFADAKEFYNINSIVDDIQNIIEDTSILNTEKENLIRCRIGQGDFREKLIRHWKACSVTNYSKHSLLIASHIKPWKDSTSDERLDLYNGLLLIPNLDKLFDKGYISFDTNGKILISNDLEGFDIFGVNDKMKIKIEEEHKKYLDYHRKNVFKN